MGAGPLGDICFLLEQEDRNLSQEQLVSRFMRFAGRVSASVRGLKLWNGQEPNALLRSMSQY